MKIDIEKIKINPLKKQELDEYLKLVSLVKNNMEHPEWLGDFSKTDYINILNNRGSIIGFRYDDELVGAGVLIPSTQEDLKKFLSSELSYNEVIDFGPQMVHPNYVGNGIQRLIIETLELFSKNNNYKYVLGTIHPDNVFSINNLLKKNYLKIGEVTLKRGQRNVYRKEI
jgi:hypothetical protein